MWLEASDRSFCEACHKSFSRRQAHKCSGPVPVVLASMPSEPPAPLPEPESSLPAGGTPLPSLDSILRTQIPTVKRIPQQCRNPVTKAFTTLMRQCGSTSTKEVELRAWSLHFMFC